MAEAKTIFEKSCGALIIEGRIGFVWGAQGGSPPQDGFAVANLSFSAALPKSSSKARSRRVLARQWVIVGKLPLFKEGRFPIRPFWSAD